MTRDINTSSAGDEAIPIARSDCTELSVASYGDCSFASILPNNASQTPLGFPSEMSTDIVIGGFSAYGYEQIRVWARSLVASGFRGRKVLLAFHLEPAVIRQLEADGVEVVSAQAPGPAQLNVYMQRFWDIAMLLGQQPYRYAVTTDVRDVVFQADPVAWIESHLEDHRLVLSDEGVTFGHQDWSRTNLADAFGDRAVSLLANDSIINVGVFGGKAEAVRSAAIQTYLLAVTAAGRARVADQAAFNLLLKWGCFPNARRTTDADAFAAQLHIKLERGQQPRVANGLVCNDFGTPYAIVHQYDRSPALRTLFEQRYAG